jgi:hypothetical protein
VLKRSENCGGFQNFYLNFYEYLEGGLSRVVPRKFQKSAEAMFIFFLKSLGGGVR